MDFGDIANGIADKAKSAAEQAVQNAKDQAEEAAANGLGKLDGLLDGEIDKLEQQLESQVPDFAKPLAKKAGDAAKGALDGGFGQIKSGISGGKGGKGGFGSPGKSGGTNNRNFEHIGHFNFRIEIEGVDAGGFKAVDGLQAGVEMIEYVAGNDNVMRKLAGRPTFQPIKLTKGYVNTATLWAWFDQVAKGDVPRKSGSIILLADDGQQELARYNFFEAYPRKWSGFQLDGKGQNATVEEIEIVVERLQRAK